MHHMKETIKLMIEILKSHNGECTNEILLEELRSYDQYINQTEIDRIIRDYPQIFKRAPGMKTRDGRTIIEEGVALADGLTM